MYRRLYRIVYQIVLLIVLNVIGNAVATLLHTHIPGSIIGMVILFVLLKTNVVKLNWFEHGAEFLLGQMLLFFVPPVLGIVQYNDLWVTEGVRLFLVLLTSTLLVMLLTGLTAEWLGKLRERKKQHAAD